MLYATIDSLPWRGSTGRRNFGTSRVTRSIENLWNCHPPKNRKKATSTQQWHPIRQQSAHPFFLAHLGATIAHLAGDLTNCSSSFPGRWNSLRSRPMAGIIFLIATQLSIAKTHPHLCDRAVTETDGLEKAGNQSMNPCLFLPSHGHLLAKIRKPSRKFSHNRNRQVFSRDCSI